MIQLNDINSVITTLGQTITTNNVTVELQNLTRLRATYATNPSAYFTQAQAIINKIANAFKSIPYDLWDREHQIIAETLGFSDFLGDKGETFFNNIINTLRTNPGLASTTLQNAITPINNAVNKIVQFQNLIEPFAKSSNVEILQDGFGIIELTFDSNVSIEDFNDAKHQMDDWYLIIDGYARLLNVRREDFEIITISKNSPTKFRIKTAIVNVSAVVGVFATLLSIEKTVLEKKLIIEQLKQNTIISDQGKQEAFIKDAEENIEKEVDAKIEKAVEQKLKEHGIKKGDGNGDINNSLSRSIHNQYNFIVNGGTVNFYVTDGKVKQAADTLENIKKDIKLIKQKYENQKAIVEGSVENQEENLNAEE